MTSVILPELGLKKKCWEQWTQVIYLHNAVEERVLWEETLRAGVSCQCLEEGESIACSGVTPESTRERNEVFSTPLLTKVIYCGQGVRDKNPVLLLLCLSITCWFCWMGVCSVELIMSKTQESKRGGERKKGKETQAKRGNISWANMRGEINEKSILWSVFPFTLMCPVSVACSPSNTWQSLWGNLSISGLGPGGTAHWLQSSGISRNHSHGSRWGSQAQEANTHLARGKSYWNQQESILSLSPIFFFFFALGALQRQKLCLCILPAAALQTLLLFPKEKQKQMAFLIAAPFLFPSEQENNSHLCALRQ